MAALEGKVLFALQGSMVDLINRRIPNYRNATSRQMMRVVDGAVQTYAIEANTPAFDESIDDNGEEAYAIYLEPQGVNLLSHNMDLTQSVWEYGSAVSIDPQSGLAPNGSDRSDAVTFTGGDRSPSQATLQILSRSLSLPADTHFQLRLFLMLAEGNQFALDSTNVVRVSGDVASGDPVYLADLNDHPGRFRELILPFKSGGTQPAPIEDGGGGAWSVTTIHSSTEVTLTHSSGLSDPIEAGHFVGGRLAFLDPPSTEVAYLITANEASVGDTVRFTLEPGTNISGDGVTTSSSAAPIGAPEQLVDIEIYSTSIAKIYWGGIFLEEGTFPTSPIYQREEIFVRDRIELDYLDSPVESRSSFGLFIDLKEWRGDGNLVDIDNFRMEIVDGDLQITIGSTTTSIPNLPSRDAAIYVDVSEESQLTSLYLNQVLISRVGTSAFTGNLDATMRLGSDGVRVIRRLLITRSLLDGQTAVGQKAGQEVETLFTDPEVIPFRLLASTHPRFELPSVTVPGRSAPIAETRVTGITSNQLSVVDSSGFVSGAEVEIWRNGVGLPNSFFVKRAFIDSSGGVPDSTTINLVDAGDIQLNDYVVFGDRVPGTASVRFPFTPIDVQTITNVDPGARTITVENASGFVQKRAFIQDERGRDVAEVLVENVNTSSEVLSVDRVPNGVAVGNYISQVLLDKELLLPPSVTEIFMLDHVEGIEFSKYQNGVKLTNTRSEAVEVRLQVQVHL